MTTGEISSRVSLYTGADTTNYSDTDRLVAYNIAVDEIETLIFRSQDMWEFDDANNTGDPYKTINTTANTQTYTLTGFDANICQIKRVEISYDGIKWDKVEPIALSEITNATDTTSSNIYFMKTEPKYALVGSKIWIFPIPDSSVANGLKVFFARLNTSMTSAQWASGTIVPGIDRNFHDGIAAKMAYDYAAIKSLNNAGYLAGLWEQTKQRIIDWYSHKTKDKRPQMRARYVNYK